MNTQDPSIILISDLHLSASQPHLTALFERFCANFPESAQRLIILGDFFNIWIGDDIATAYHHHIAAQLTALAHRGVQIEFMPGNRDFLLKGTFLTAMSAKLLSDPEILVFGETSYVLSHGDMLCTDDRAYQRMRRVFHCPWVQHLFLSLPRRARRWLANRIRRSAQQATQHKPAQLMDVNTQAVDDLLLKTDADVLIHGHTHRQGCHELGEKRRYVLGDWRETGNYLQIFTDQTPRFETVL